MAIVEKLKKNKRPQTVQFLFTMFLFLILAVCALITITFGARVYENIDQRMNENFIETTALSYVSNKIKQADESNAVSVTTMENTKVLKIEQTYNEEKYITLIYYMDGTINELFCAEDAGLTLQDGIPIMEGEGLDFQMLDNNLLKVETKGEHGDSILLALRSEG